MTDSEAVVVAGGGIAGLATSLFLGRSGVRVILVDPGLASMPNDARELAKWRRRGIPQFWHGHTLHALGRQVLERCAPDMLDYLRDQGANLFPFEGLIRYEPQLGDSKLVATLVRRPLLDWTLHKLVMQQASVTVRTNSPVSELLVSTNALEETRVSGVRLRNGELIRAARVVDATGRSAKSNKWLRAAGLKIPSQESDRSNRTYFCQHFIAPRASLSSQRSFFFGPFGEADGVRISFLKEDNDFVAVTFNADRREQSLRSLLDPKYRMRLLKRGGFPEGWLPDEQQIATNDLHLVGGTPNRLALEPTGVTGLVQIGDAYCTTNPTHGWGISLALAHSEIVSSAIASNSQVDQRLVFDRLRKATMPAFETSSLEAADKGAEFRKVSAQDSGHELFPRRYLYPLAFQDDDILRFVATRTQLLDFTADASELVRRLHDSGRDLGLGSR